MASLPGDNATNAKPADAISVKVTTEPIQKQQQKRRFASCSMPWPKDHTGRLLFVFIAVVIIDIIVAFYIGTKWYRAILGVLVGVGSAILLEHAIRTRIIVTMQDGVISLARNPFRFSIAFAMLLAGYVLGLLAPWLIK